MVQQYQGAEYNPIDRFTISPEELDASINKLRKYFNLMMQRIVQQKLNAGQHQVRQQQHPPPQAIPQIPQAQMHPLNAENLQQQQQALQMARKASLQKQRVRDSRPPAAPTSSQPPFPIGAASPQYFIPNELTQEKLKFPPAKKRKGNQQGSAASTPAQALGTPGSSGSPQLTKVGSPEMQRHTSSKLVEAPSAFKCPVENCESKVKSFSTQMALADHIFEVHETKEQPIEDPLSWAIEGVALGLGLDINGKKKPSVDDADASKKAGGAPKMQATLSKQGETPKLKQEVATPANGVTTPMVRPSTQTGPSPSSNLLKTPQTTVTKTPGPGASGVKTLASRSSKGEFAKTPAPNAVSSIRRSPTPPEPWADSSIKPDDLVQCFDGLDTLQVIGPFAQMQASLTPASTQSGNSRGDKKDSPRESDISENDQLQINIATGDEPFWNPFGLYDGLTGDLEELKFGDEMIMMDWERLEESGKKSDVVNGSGTGTGEAGWAPSPGWNPDLFVMR